MSLFNNGYSWNKHQTTSVKLLNLSFCFYSHVAHSLALNVWLWNMRPCTRCVSNDDDFITNPPFILVGTYRLNLCRIVMSGTIGRAVEKFSRSLDFKMWNVPSYIVISCYCLHRSFKSYFSNHTWTDESGICASSVFGVLNISHNSIPRQLSS